MKRIIFLVIVFILVIVALIASGQTKKVDIVTDRPDQTETPALIPQGSLQIETGFFLNRITSAR